MALTKLLEDSIFDYESLASALTSVLDNLGRLYTDLPLELLCGIATPKTTTLLGFRGKGIYPIMDELGVICMGDSSLIQYLSKHIELFWPAGPLNSDVVAAAYLLKRAEEFVDGCNGPMDLVVLQSGPKINVIDPKVIEELDQRLAKNHEKAFTDLLSLSPPFSI